MSDTGVYVSYTCNVYDFNPLTGSQIWSYNAGCSGGGKSPVLAGDRLYTRDPSLVSTPGPAGW